MTWYMRRSDWNVLTGCSTLTGDSDELLGVLLDVLIWLGRMLRHYLFLIVI